MRVPISDSVDMVLIVRVQGLADPKVDQSFRNFVETRNCLLQVGCRPFKSVEL